MKAQITCGEMKECPSLEPTGTHWVTVSLYEPQIAEKELSYA